MRNRITSILSFSKFGCYREKIFRCAKWAGWKKSRTKRSHCVGELDKKKYKEKEKEKEK